MPQWMKEDKISTRNVHDQQRRPEVVRDDSTQNKMFNFVYSWNSDGIQPQVGLSEEK